ncbi:hypothetical protein [Arthrobacter sp. CDRTa11]|nr:hypothetical protein [Arthrobacter sp. CDRTa11]
MNPLLALAHGKYQGTEPAEKFDGGRRLPREVRVDVVGHGRRGFVPG